jgi:hypothetical protein
MPLQQHRMAAKDVLQQLFDAQQASVGSWCHLWRLRVLLRVVLVGVHCSLLLTMFMVRSCCWCFCGSSCWCCCR